MKVLVVAKSFSKGGAATGARNTLNSLRRAGAAVVALDGYAAQTGRPIGALRTTERIYERLSHGSDTHCLRLGPPVFDLQALCRVHRPDVIQLCDVSGNTIAFEDLKALPCPVVHRLSDFWPYHGARHYNDRPPRSPSFADRVLRWTLFDGTGEPDFFVAPSQWLADRMQRGRVQVIRNAVERVPDIAARPRPAGRLRFGFISNPVQDPRKGLAVVPKALDAVSARTGAVELHLFGKGSDAGVPNTPGLEVIAHPPFGRDTLARVYSCFDILLCPSVLDNSPNVLTEALAHGVPVLAQSGTGMDSYITNEFGALVDFQGSVPSDIADAVERLVSGYADASAAALRYATEFLGPDRIGDQYLSLYNALISGRQ
jgi:glycosyltransferase involved in cell wall biosynthesis